MLLPRGKLVKSPFNPIKMNWLEAIGKLSEGRFSGYLYCWGEPGSGVLLFVGGNLAAIRFNSGSAEFQDAEALERIFLHSLTGDMTLAIYRVSQELGLQLYTVLSGEVLYRGQQLHLMDIPHVLEKLKQDRFSGCLRVGTGEDLSMIFFSEGKPLGFFHDSSTDLTHTADLDQSVARLPGAALDIIAGKQDTEAELPDLMRNHDVSGFWSKAVEKAKANKAG